VPPRYTIPCEPRFAPDGALKGISLSYPGYGHSDDEPGRQIATWPGSDLAAVLEEQYMDEEEFHSFYKPKMDRSISNVGVQFEGAVALFKFQELLDDLLDDQELGCGKRVGDAAFFESDPWP